MRGLAYINGTAFPFHGEETVLAFVRRNEGDIIPTLCDAPNLEPFGSCRVCSVDVALEANGKARTVASCHTRVQEGWHIYTDSENIARLRKNIIELVVTDHPLECANCEVNGNCELQTVAAKVGITGVRYPEGRTHTHQKKDLSHPYMTSDLAKCINCYRCVRACDEVQGQFVLSMYGRGFDSRIIKSQDQTFAASDCVSCGACAQACPTSAISDVFESKSILPTDTSERTVCTYCGVGCNLQVYVRNGEVKKIRAPYDAEVNQGHTCLKGRYAFSFYNHKDRLRSPMIRKNRKFETVGWEEAYDFITGKFREIKEKYGPDAIAGISSARCTNEENYLMQKFIRAVIGTNNIDGCARVCHSPTALGMQRAFGTGAATNSIEDINHTQCMLVIGANPTAAHPVTGAKMKQAAIRGKTLIVIDPRKIELTKYADYHLAIRPGTNVAILNMMLWYVIKEGLENGDFIASRTEGYTEFKEAILNLSLDDMERVTGVERELVRKATIAYATSGASMSFHGLGVTEHTQGTGTVMLIADLAMITGNVGRPGTGVNPLRGQNNVQGMADMGSQPHQGAGYLDVTKADIHHRYEDFYKATLSKKVGYKIPQMYDAALDGNLKALWCIGEDMAQTDPNTNHVIAALKKLDLFIVQEIFMTETAKLAHVVLPGTTFLEKSGTFTNGERRIQRVNKVVDPLPGTRTDGQIVVDIMNRMGYPQPDYDPATALEEISQIVPFFAGVKWEELGKNGKQWPVNSDGSDTQILHTDTFKRGKGKFYAVPFKETKEIVEHGKEFPFILTTNRELEHYNCGTMTRRTRNAQLLKEDVLLIHPKDAGTKGIRDGDLACVISARGKTDLRSVLTEDVRPGVLSTTFHFPELNVNTLTSSISDEDAMCPEYKVVAVDVRRSKGNGRK